MFTSSPLTKGKRILRSPVPSFSASGISRYDSLEDISSILADEDESAIYYDTSDEMNTNRSEYEDSSSDDQPESSHGSRSIGSYMKSLSLVETTDNPQDMADQETQNTEEVNMTNADGVLFELNGQSFKTKEEVQMHFNALKLSYEEEYAKLEQKLIESKLEVLECHEKMEVVNVELALQTTKWKRVVEQKETLEGDVICLHALIDHLKEENRKLKEEKEKEVQSVPAPSCTGSKTLPKNSVRTCAVKLPRKISVCNANTCAKRCKLDKDEYKAPPTTSRRGRR